MDFESYQSKLSKKHLELLSVVESGSLAEVKKVTSQFRNLDKDEVFTYILLVTALRRQHKSISKFLINMDCKLTISLNTKVYSTPLYYAVEMDSLEIFRALRKKGAAIFEKDANNDTVLELILQKRKFGMVEFLLNELKPAKRSKSLSPHCENDVALFHAACWVGNLSAIEIFLKRGFSLTSRSAFCIDEWKGFTPLHFAIEGFDSGSLGILFKHCDGDLYAKDCRGRTPLHLVFRTDKIYLLRDEAIMKRLIQTQGNRFINPADENGLSHLHVVCSFKFFEKDNEKHLELIKQLIDSDIDLNDSISSKDKTHAGFTALHFAANILSRGVLELLLRNGADPNKTDSKGRTPLHLVCTVMEYRDEKGLEIIRLLLQHGAEHALKNSENRTPLHCTFYSRYSDRRPLDESAKLLLASNEQGINHTDGAGVSYLHLACKGDDLNPIKILISNGASVNSCVVTETTSSPYSGYSPLHFATDSNQFEVVKFLLTSGANANSMDFEHITPLHLACDHKLYDLEKSVKSVAMHDDECNWPPGRTNLILMIELLIEHGASVDVKTSSGRTPLLNNCTTPTSVVCKTFSETQKFLVCKELFIRQEKIMDILLRHGADIKARCDDRGSVLHIVTKYYRVCPLNRELAKIALSRGANVDAVDKKSKFTPLHVAVEEEREYSHDFGMIDLFLESGANINAKSKYLGTPLHLTLLPSFMSRFIFVPSKYRNLFMKLLCHPKVDLNAQDRQEQTPLHIAMIQRDYFVIDKLLQHGSDINIEDSCRNTPVYYFLNQERTQLDIRDCGSNVYKILTLIVMHVKKLMRLKLFVSEMVRSQYQELLDNILAKDEAGMDSQIDNQIEFLKSQKLDAYTSFYDILFKNSSAMAKHVLNKNLRAAITSINSGSDFSFFGGIIKSQFNKGCKRSEVLQPAKVALSSVTRKNWPDSCSEQILSYLSDEVLEKLIKSAPSERKSKRSDMKVLPQPRKSKTKVRRCK